MARGKKICNVLKQVRQQIADANGIEYSPHACHHVGECRGTCPACEAEMHYLEQCLMDKYGNGFVSKVAGMTIGLTALCTSANAQEISTRPVPQQKDSLYFNGKKIELNRDSLESEGYYLVKGIVKYKDMEPVVGATVSSTKEDFKVLTNTKGEYLIPLKAGNSISIELVGMKPQTISFNQLDIKNYNVTVLQDSDALTGEVIVVGAVSGKKKSNENKSSVKQSTQKGKSDNKTDETQTDSQEALAASQEQSRPILLGEISETSPQFPGGNDALKKYIADHLVYPPQCQFSSGQGRLVVSFVVTKDGSVKYPKVIRGVNPLIDEAVLKVVKGMPKWIPGRRGSDEFKSTTYAIPIDVKW